MTTRTAIIVGLAIYASLISFLSVFIASRVREADDYLIAGRRIPFWILTGSIVGTCVGTGATIGASGLAFQHGWAGSAYPMSLGLGVLVTGLLFASMRRYNFMTLGEEIACYYGKNRAVVEFSNISLFLSQLGWLTVQIMGGGAVLNAILGLGPKLSIIVAGVIIAVLCIPGGLRAVIYVAFLQGILLIVGFGSLAKVALMSVGGLSGLRASSPSVYFSFLGIKSLGWLQLAGLIIVLVLGIVAEPGRRLSVYGAKSESVGRWSMLLAGSAVVLFSATIGIAGMYVLKLNPGLLRPDLALPWLILNALPPWLAALLTVVISSAIFSSASGSASAIGSFFVRHIYHSVTHRYPKHPVAATRFGLVGAFVLSTSVALRASDIVGFVMNFLPLTATGLAIVILFGRFWKRSNWQGAMAALVVTPVVALLLMLFRSNAGLLRVPILPAAAAGVMVQVAVSLLTPASDHSFEEVAEAMKDERQAIEGESVRAGSEGMTGSIGSGLG